MNILINKFLLLLLVISTTGNASECLSVNFYCNNPIKYLKSKPKESLQQLQEYLVMNLEYFCSEGRRLQSALEIPYVFNDCVKYEFNSLNGRTYFITREEFDFKKTLWKLTLGLRTNKQMMYHISPRKSLEIKRKKIIEKINNLGSLSLADYEIE